MNKKTAPLFKMLLKRDEKFFLEEMGIQVDVFQFLEPLMSLNISFTERAIWTIIPKGLSFEKVFSLLEKRYGEIIVPSDFEISSFEEVIDKDRLIIFSSMDAECFSPDKEITLLERLVLELKYNFIYQGCLREYVKENIICQAVNGVHPFFSKAIYCSLNRIYLLSGEQKVLKVKVVKSHS